ncbi:MAG: apolipoprotein N-acyltransferase [Pirellulales bacterium]
MDSTAEITLPWYRSTLAIALIGGLLFWAALPPLAFGWLGWIAPVPWLWLVRSERLAGRRPYGAIWLAGFCFWLLTLHWLRYPHPAVYLGWIALSAYLAFYLPVFVGLSRVAVHRLGVPLWLAAPIVWTGLELARAHLLTGFLLGSLAHTQAKWTAVIQFSDLVGEYGVDFLVMMVAACITCIAFPPRQPWAMVPAGLLLVTAIAYGQRRIEELNRPLAGDNIVSSKIRIALIQGNSLAEWKQDPDRERQIMDEYVALSERAVAMAKERGDGRPLDLVVWPETMFRSGLRTFDPGYKFPAGVGRTTDEVASYGPKDLASLVRRLGTPVLVGIDRGHFRVGKNSNTDPPPLLYNSAVLVDRDGRIAGTYDKVHRVMFGEYIPFADWFPFFYRLTPLTGGIHAGAAPVVLELDDKFYAPNICYETVIPHVIRRQAATLVGGSVPADVLINLTNDAWYWGSSGLDLHLACGVFRAVEARLPLVIAANGGISAWIGRDGRIRAQSPRQQTDVILADIERRFMASWYVDLGDWFAAACLTCCVLLAIIGGFVPNRQQASVAAGAK